jgi:hypothetical protein
VNGRKAKADLKAALQWVKRRCDNELSYVWFAEFTKAGTIHFHVLLSCTPTTCDVRDFGLYWYKRTDQGQGRYCHIRQRRERDVRESIIAFNQHGNVWEELRSRSGARRYCAKYATKPHQKKVPVWFRDIGRFWGASRDVRESVETPKLVVLSEDELREVLQQYHHKTSDWEVLPRHLWAIEADWFRGLS